MKPDPKVACALGTAGMSAGRVIGASALQASLPGGAIGGRAGCRPCAGAVPRHAGRGALRTGERSPLSYLAKPLTDYFSRSLRGS